MRFTVDIAAFLFVVASLALVDRRAECGCLTGSKNKLSKEWQWIDNFLKDGASSERLNWYLSKSSADNQAEMEPKLREAFRLVLDAINMEPEKSGCSESESLQVARLFEALKLDLSAKTDRTVAGVHKLAFECRQKYGNFCAGKYTEKLLEPLDSNISPEVSILVEKLAISYARDRKIELSDLFSPAAERSFNSAGFITSGLMGKALYWAFKDTLPKRRKEINSKTGKEEHQWAGLVEEMRDHCSAYVALVEDALVEPSKDAVVPRSLEQLDTGCQLWRSWSATLACAQLKRFDDEKLADKLAAAFAKSEKS